jgi:hypothetical protein
MWAPAENSSIASVSSMQAIAEQRLQRGSGMYNYERIVETDTIRVLELFKGMNDILECSIKEIKISDSGYQALSYEWGSADKPYEIFVRDDKGKDLGALPLIKFVACT